MTAGQETRLGLTYWPIRKGPFFWEAFDSREVAHELAHVADLGCSLVRVLLPWETFHPWENHIATPAFDAFGRLLDAAEQAGLGVVPVLFVGHLYGQRFLPRWLLTPALAPDVDLRTISGGSEYIGRVKDFYTSRPLLDAQRYFVRELVGFYGQHPAVHAWDVGGNGVMLVAPPPAPEAAVEWLAALTQAVEEADEERHPVWCSLPAEVLTCPEMPSLAAVCETGARLALDVYPALCPEAEGPQDADFVAYVLLLAAALAGESVSCSGTGLPTAGSGLPAQVVEVPRGPDEPPRRVHLFSEEDQAAYLERVLAHATALDVPLVAWATFADVPPALWEEPPFDQAILPRYLGLVRADGREKEATAVTRLWARHPAADEFRSPFRGRELAVDPEEFARNPRQALADWYRAFREGEM